MKFTSRILEGVTGVWWLVERRQGIGWGLNAAGLKAGRYSPFIRASAARIDLQGLRPLWPALQSEHDLVVGDIAALLRAADTVEAIFTSCVLGEREPSVGHFDEK